MATIDQLRKTKLVAKDTSEKIDIEVFTCVDTLQVDEPIIEKIYMVVKVDMNKNTRSILSFHKKGINAEETVRRMEKMLKKESIYFEILEHEIID